MSFFKRAKALCAWAFGVMMLIGVSMNAQHLGLDSVKIGNVDVPLIFERSGNLPIGEVELVFLGGAVAGSEMSKGAHSLGYLSAKLLNEGTKSLGSVEFAKKLENKAIDFEASVGLQTLRLELSFLKEFQNDAFALLGELLSEPNLSESTLSKLKALALSDIASDEDDFDEVADANLSKILFKDTPMAHKTIGDKESVNATTLAQIKAFLSQNLALKRLVIVAGGDMEIEAFKEAISRTLAILPEGEEREKLHFKVNPLPQSVSVKKPTQQAFIYFGAPFDVLDSETNYMARVMSFILGGGGFGSRMMEEVRVKRGLAYSAYMRISVGGAAEYASGYLQTKLENKDEAIKVVREVIGEFVKNGVSEAELSAAKAFLLGSEPLREEKLSQRLDAKFLNYFRDLPLNQHKLELERIKTLTLDELNAYIKSHEEMLNLSFSIVEGQ